MPGTFGEWVRQQRQERRLTRAELAQRIGCSVAMLRKIEADERRPSVQIAELLANALEIPAASRPTFVRVARGELGINRLALSTTEAEAAPAPPRPASFRSSFPIFPTPLVGRQRELTALQDLLRDPGCRLLTLLGTGGMGKTRLASELALQLRDDFRDGICFVPLAGASSMRLLEPTIADAIGFSFQRADPENPRAQLFNHLQDKQMLLLLDNLEQLLSEPGIEVLAELLAAAPQVKLLITSREPLNLTQEQVFELQGLPIPPEAGGGESTQDTSMELFLQRARRAHASFAASTSDYPEIVRICRLVDGIPLAIELAAAWVRSLSCAEIAFELERSLDLLSTSARDIPPRHRSMKAAFDHSWELLSEDEQGALARLSVFHGGFDRDAAEQVAGANLRMLSALVAKSLVRRTATGRYDLHELIRQYAALHLEADPRLSAEARQRHFVFYLRLAEAADGHLRGAGQLEWLRRLEDEHGNLRAALEWGTSEESEAAGMRKGEPGLRLAASLRWFWRMRSYYEEGRGWLGRVLALASGARSTMPEREEKAPDREQDAAARAQASAKAGLALLTDSVSDHITAHALASESAALFRQTDDRQGLAEALMLVGQTLRWQGEAAEGRECLREALAISRDIGDRWSTAQALYRLGADLSDFGHDPAGRLMLEESAAILQQLGDKFVSVSVLIALGIVDFGLGDYGAALERFQRGLELGREIGDPWGIADALTNIGCVERVRGDHAGASSHFQEALKVYKYWGQGGWCADPLCALAENALSQADLVTAREHLGEARAYTEKSGNSWLHVLVGYFRGLLAYYEGDLDEASALLERTATLARASQYSPDLARALVTLGRTLHAKGEVEKARMSTLEGLSLYWASGCKLGMATALESLAALSPPEKAERAARLLGTAGAMRDAIGAPMPIVDRGEHERTVEAIRVRLGEAAVADAILRGRNEPFEAVVSEIVGTVKAEHPDYSAAALPATGIQPRPTTALGAT